MWLLEKTKTTYVADITFLWDGPESVAFTSLSKGPLPSHKGGLAEL